MYTDEQFAKSFPLRRSPQDAGNQIELGRLYKSDSDKCLTFGGIPLTGKPGTPGNEAEFIDTVRRIYWTDAGSGPSDLESRTHPTGEN
jgi:hypothetical protein